MGLCAVAALQLGMLLQPTESVVSGTVRNAATNEPTPAVVVVIADLRRTTRTDSGGRYVFHNIPAGPHQITVRAFGFAPRAVQALVPTEGELEINFALISIRLRLPVLFVRQSVEVPGTDTGTAGSVADRRLSIASVRHNPFATETDVLSALVGGSVAARAESPNGLHVRGASTDQVMYALDGIPVFNPYHAAGVFSAWNPDAIASIELSSSLPSPADASALSGTVSAHTRKPSGRSESLGSVSTTQARITASGPVGIGRAYFLASVRSGLPAPFAPRYEASYVRGETVDRLLKVELPLLRGELRLLGTDSNDEIRTSALVTDAPTTPGTLPENTFAWNSASLGADWNRVGARYEWRVLSWRATADADAWWNASRVPVALRAQRRDAGLLVSIKHATTRVTTQAGMRLERTHTQYRVTDGLSNASRVAALNAYDISPMALSGGSLHARTLVSSAFLQQELSLTPRAAVHTGVSVAVHAGRVFAAPRLQLQWTASDRVQLSVTGARLQQFVQSLRNAESVVGNVFPADLFVGAGPRSVPVAQSEHGILSARIRPHNRLQLNAELYVRRATNVLLVAPNDAAPFATRGFSIGRTGSRGVQIDASLSGTRTSWLARYGLQRVTTASAAGSYEPQHGSRHTFDAGMIVFPNPTWSLRVGISGSGGRRATTISGPFEWEACNLQDRGCEFAGSPLNDVAALGRSRLPLYARVDAGVRKHWHFSVGGQDAEIALFGAASNLLGRHNVLTFARDAERGLLTPIEMRSRAPLVIGMEWRF